MAIFGSNIIATGDVQLWENGGVNFNWLYRPNSSGRYIAVSGDRVVSFSLYVSGGTGGDSVFGIGFYNLSSPADPATAARLVQATVTVTAAMKASPGWKTFDLNIDLTPFAGIELGFQIGGVDVGSVTSMVDWVNPDWSSSGVNEDSETGPNPWGGSWDGSYRPSAYFEITSAAVANPGLRITDLYRPNEDALVADASGVDAVVYNVIGGTERWQGSVAISGGDVVIDNDAVGDIDDEVFLVLRWEVIVNPGTEYERTDEYTYAATETVVDLDA